MKKKRQRFILTNRQIQYLITGANVLSALAAVGAVAFALWSARAQNELTRELTTKQFVLTRELTSQQFFLQFYGQWESEGMQERRARLADALLQEPIPADIDDSPLVFLETVSNATRRGLVDRDFVWTTFSVDIMSYWPAAKPYVERIRQLENDPTLFIELERLNDSFIGETKRRGEDASLIGNERDSIRRFLEWEKKRKVGEKF